MPHDAVILSYCGHVVCKHCLENHVKLYDSEELQCPCVDGVIKCPGLIYDRELRVSVSEETYNIHLKRVIKLIEAQSDNSFHCQTPECDYWVIIEDTIIDSMLCPSCKVINCLRCRAIHKNMSCLEYTALQSQDENLKMTELEIENKIREGIIMRCPNCSVVIEKMDGCDGLYCPKCNLQLCWATKGPRWGKKGRGDTSGGCRCGVGGQLCHPECNFCH
ncbi:hypothetical protein HELRODRAFT_106565 [Helobdella robusta]|uniref:RING-type domain-containing protein n=1 Tax=Helobdella robusta TaxID=6412 RepID=T1EE34_HELRO|nr:hypothetical protein HELRODRAFT_106565 [Helobdella robusta]ESO02288.1 hypothetical protein HELRODRAFT_106565 [Helobdella robusta]